IQVLSESGHNGLLTCLQIHMGGTIQVNLETIHPSPFALSVTLPTRRIVVLKRYRLSSKLASDFEEVVEIGSKEFFMFNLHLIPFHFFAHGLLNKGTGWIFLRSVTVTNT